MPINFPEEDTQWMFLSDNNIYRYHLVAGAEDWYFENMGQQRFIFF